MVLDEWLEEITSSKNETFLKLKNELEKAMEVFRKKVPVPERTPFDDETFGFDGNFSDSVEFMLDCGSEGRMFGLIPVDILARYGRVDESRFGEGFVILRSRFGKKIVDAWVVMGTNARKIMIW
jgi:hypothetical protein